MVTNDALEPATITALDDDVFDLSVHCADAVGTGLAPSGSYSCTFTENISGNVGDDHRNTVTAVGADNEGNTNTVSDFADVAIVGVDPEIRVEKTGSASIAEGGATASYSVTIFNDSVATDPLTVTSLDDDQFGDLLPEAEAANGGAPDRHRPRCQLLVRLRSAADAGRRRDPHQHGHRVRGRRRADPGLQ